MREAPQQAEKADQRTLKPSLSPNSRTRECIAKQAGQQGIFLLLSIPNKVWLEEIDCSPVRLCLPMPLGRGLTGHPQEYSLLGTHKKTASESLLTPFSFYLSWPTGNVLQLLATTSSITFCITEDFSRTCFKRTGTRHSFGFQESCPLFGFPSVFFLACTVIG